MITETSGKEELLPAIDEAFSQMLELASTLSEEEVNTIPYKDSWTPGELLRHVSKSTQAIGGAMKKKSPPAQRNTGEKIPMLRKTFLDFSHKLNAPDFIVPEKRTYTRQASIDELKQAAATLTTNAEATALDEEVKGLPMGDVTKLELLHFVLYHTQRHQHQFKKIMGALKVKE
jgi:hypothetical protein